VKLILSITKINIKKNKKKKSEVDSLFVPESNFNEILPITDKDDDFGENENNNLEKSINIFCLFYKKYIN
jgi:hypothetical protein